MRLVLKERVVHFPELALGSGGECGFMGEEGVGIAGGGGVFEDEADVSGLGENARQHVGGAGAGEGLGVGEDEDGDGGTGGATEPNRSTRRSENRCCNGQGYEIAKGVHG